MEKIIEYIKLKDGEEHIELPSISFTKYNKASNIKLIPDGTYSFLFVLKGKVYCDFNNSRSIIEKGYLLVIDKDKIHKCTCSANSIILEYLIRGRMSTLMKSILDIFNKHCSDLIPINKEIQDWCQNLIDEHTPGVHKTGDYDRERCIKLTTLLLNYPQEVLGILFIPLHACLLKCKSGKVCIPDQKQHQVD